MRLVGEFLDDFAPLHDIAADLRDERGKLAAFVQRQTRTPFSSAYVRLKRVQLRSVVQQNPAGGRILSREIDREPSLRRERRLAGIGDRVPEERAVRGRAQFLTAALMAEGYVGSAVDAVKVRDCRPARFGAPDVRARERQIDVIVKTRGASGSSASSPSYLRYTA